MHKESSLSLASLDSRDESYAVSHRELGMRGSTGQSLAPVSETPHLIELPENQKSTPARKHTLRQRWL